MDELKFKVCLVGDFAVGKSSLVRRYVQNAFSEKYQTTVGVKIDTKSVNLDGTAIKLVIWDIFGDHTLTTVNSNYLRGAAGCLFVADGTRGHTLHTMQHLGQKAHPIIGDVPRIWLINKADLVSEWEVTDRDISALDTKDSVVLRTSAREGSNVEEAFARLAGIMAKG